VSHTPVRECGYRIRGLADTMFSRWQGVAYRRTGYAHGHLGKLRHGDSGAKSVVFWTDPASAFPADDLGRYAHKEHVEMVQAWTC
jgi:hypothetical protein